MIPSNAQFFVGGSRRYVGGGLDSSVGDWWYFDFLAPDGDILAPGETYKATRYPFNGTGAGMDVSGNGRGCNELSGTFTVNHAAYWQDGSLKSAAITFKQHCEHATAALRGTLEYRRPVGDVTPPGPPTNVKVTRSGSSAKVAWTNPGASDYAATIVRYVRGGGSRRRPTAACAGLPAPARPSPCTGWAASATWSYGSTPSTPPATSAGPSGCARNGFRLPAHHVAGDAGGHQPPW